MASRKELSFLKQWGQIGLLTLALAACGGEPTSSTSYGAPPSSGISITEQQRNELGQYSAQLHTMLQRAESIGVKNDVLALGEQAVPIIFHAYRAAYGGHAFPSPPTLEYTTRYDLLQRIANSKLELGQIDFHTYNFIIQNPFDPQTLALINDREATIVNGKILIATDGAEVQGRHGRSLLEALLHMTVHEMFHLDVDPNQVKNGIHYSYSGDDGKLYVIPIKRIEGFVMESPGDGIPKLFRNLDEAAAEEATNHLLSDILGVKGREVVSGYRVFHNTLATDMRDHSMDPTQLVALHRASGMDDLLVQFNPNDSLPMGNLLLNTLYRYGEQFGTVQQ